MRMPLASALFCCNALMKIAQIAQIKVRLQLNERVWICMFARLELYLLC